jgi:DNA-binding MarR family transcriptional regulator
MQAPFDLTGLGLTSAQAAVLAGIAAQGVSTAVYLCGHLRLSAEAVSRAVAALVDMGLVERGVGRPRPLRLSPQLEDALLRLRAGMRTDHERQRKTFAAAAGALQQAREAAELGPAPATGLVPSQPVTANPNIDLIGRRTSWDEVLNRQSPVFGSRGWLLRAKHLGIHARLLLVGEPPRPSVVRGVRRFGHHLRMTDDDLPALMISDGRRVRVEVNARGARRHGWSEDPRHVVLAQAAFDVAWAKAREVPEVAPRVR